MARTDAHVPLRVRLARGDVPAAAWHASRHDVCDLPDIPDHARRWLPATQCYWTWQYDGHNICSCPLCYDHAGRLRDIRRERRRTRQQIRVALGRPSADMLSDLAGPLRRRDWWR
jgi:hypothetical protein